MLAPRSLRHDHLVPLLVVLSSSCTGWSTPEDLEVPEPSPQWYVDGDARPDAPPDAPPTPIAPRNAVRSRPSHACRDAIAPLVEEDGASPRQRAMFAPGPPRQPLPDVLAWLADHDITLEDLGNELGPALGEAGYFDCHRVATILDQEVAVCTRAYVIDGADLSKSDWVLLVPTTSRLQMVTIGTYEVGIHPPRGMNTGPYLRLDLSIDEARGLLTRYEAAPDTCAYACGWARVAERALAEQGLAKEDPSLSPTFVIADHCADLGDDLGDDLGTVALHDLLDAAALR